MIKIIFFNQIVAISLFQQNKQTMYTANIYTLAENGKVANFNQFEKVEFTPEASKADGVVGEREVKKALKKHLKGSYIEVYFTAGQTVTHPMYTFKKK